MSYQSINPFDDRHSRPLATLSDGQLETKLASAASL